MSDQAKQVRLRGAKIVATTTVLTLIGIYLYYPYSPAVRQRKNMDAAEQHLSKILSLVRSDSRFSHVRTEVYTGNGGGLIVLGAVRSQDDLDHLRYTVDSTSPPVQVTWAVKVYPPSLFDQIVP